MLNVVSTEMLLLRKKWGLDSDSVNPRYKPFYYNQPTVGIQYKYKAYENIHLFEKPSSQSLVSVFLLI